MTVVVGGAAVPAMPSAIIAIGARNPLQYEVDGPDKAKSAKPTAAIVGPAISGTRAPTRSSKPPDQRDKTPIMIVKGKNTAPASRAESPCTSTNSNRRKKK